MARSLLRRRDLLTTSCHRERSAAIYWRWDCFHHATSVARGRLTFRLRKKSLSLHRNDKKLVASVKTTCHGERPCASWPSVSDKLRASLQTSCHRERTEANYS